MISIRKVLGNDWQIEGRGECPWREERRGWAHSLSTHSVKVWRERWRSRPRTDTDGVRETHRIQ